MSTAKVFRHIINYWYAVSLDRIAVYHLGGGSFDTSIIEVKGGHFQVRSTNGNASLGGVDFDNALLDYIISETKEDVSLYSYLSDFLE